MARGWESKSIESQQEAAEQARALRQKQQSGLDEIARQRERESIELTRTRILNDLAAATNPRRREQLEAALEHINQKLAKL